MWAPEALSRALRRENRSALAWPVPRQALLAQLALRAALERSRGNLSAAAREIVVGDAIGICAQWNRAVAAARGDLVWLLRAGVEPCADTFAALATRAAVGPVVPAHDGERLLPGDPTGMMLACIWRMRSSLPNLRTMYSRRSMPSGGMVESSWNGRQ